MIVSALNYRKYLVILLLMLFVVIEFANTAEKRTSTTKNVAVKAKPKEDKMVKHDDQLKTGERKANTKDFTREGKQPKFKIPAGVLSKSAEKITDNIKAKPDKNIETKESTKDKLTRLKDEETARLKEKARLGAREKSLKRDQKRLSELEQKMTKMVEIKGGKFIMGIKDPSSKTGEFPTFERKVKSFFIDKYPVTNFMFRKFIMGKKMYQTHAELTGRSHVLENLLASHVKKTGVITNEHKPWILFVKGATWNRPEGGNSNTAKRMKEPVVHVSHGDAVTFCRWMGKRLPTESEWEYAARGGLKGVVYPWGDRYLRNTMNFWQGEFPHEDLKSDGFNGLSPVDAFPPQNKYGMYDMMGNVWEWTDSRYYQRGVNRYDQNMKYVVKGGSYLDSRRGHFNKIIRTANRMGHTPDFSAHFVGFRCVRTIPETMEIYVTEPVTKSNRSDPVFHRVAHMHDQRDARKRKQKIHDDLIVRMKERLQSKSDEYKRAGRRWTEDL